MKQRKRPKFESRTFRLVHDEAANRAMSLIPNLPIDPVNPLVITVAEEEKPRTKDQNALMWANQLTDIANQAYLNGRQFSKDAWHYYFKLQYLPEEYDPELCLKGYRKWDYAPNGDRLLVGSTTQLKVKGFSEYLTQIEAFGAGLGVIFTEGRQ